MTAKDYLKQARRLDAMIHSRLREIDYWKDLSSGVSSVNYDGMPHNPNRPTEAPFVRCVEKISDIQRDIEKKVAVLISLREEINEQIDLLDSVEEQMLLRYRYIDGLTWDEIERLMNVSERTAFRIHGNALAHFSVPH